MVGGVLDDRGKGLDHPVVAEAEGLGEEMGALEGFVVYRETAAEEGFQDATMEGKDQVEGKVPAAAAVGASLALVPGVEQVRAVHATLGFGPAAAERLPEVVVVAAIEPAEME